MYWHVSVVISYYYAMDLGGNSLAEGVNFEDKVNVGETCPDLNTELVGNK